MKYMLTLFVFVFGLIACDMRPPYVVQADKASQACIAQGGVPIFKESVLEKCIFKEENGHGR